MFQIAWRHYPDLSSASFIAAAFSPSVLSPGPKGPVLSVLASPTAAPLTVRLGAVADAGTARFAGVELAIRDLSLGGPAGGAAPETWFDRTGGV